MSISIDKTTLGNGDTKYTMSELEEIMDMPSISDQYIGFVAQTTSPASSTTQNLVERIDELDVDGHDVSHLLTAALGISAEGGEFTEIVKKILLQGKPYNEENKIHMKKELGDILWYIAQACIALNTNFDELIKMNYQKIASRYPDGVFNVFFSENRKEGDI
jgi:NTP pyrophosphatase (non-canonical NTP hydrolase)